MSDSDRGCGRRVAETTLQQAVTRNPGAILAAALAISATPMPISAEIAPALGGGFETLFAADRPFFRQVFDSRIEIFSSYIGSRRWNCEVRWNEYLPNSSTPAPTSMVAHFYVDPHIRDQLVFSGPKVSNHTPTRVDPAALHCFSYG
jgi:hypothetical protein